MRKFQKYGSEIRDIRGQNFNARYFDRSWLTQMSREDWREEALYIQSHLSDEDIDAAIDLFPQTAKDFNGDFLRESLRARRDDMLSIADRYYLVLAESVKVVGKTGADYFEVTRLEDGSVSVEVCPLKDGKPKFEDIFYSRTFHRKETTEIILYGLDGKDQYNIKGKSKKSILVRIVGGEENDIIVDGSSVSGLRKMTKYYDDHDNNVILGEKELKTDLRKEKYALQYDRKDFVYDTYMPLPSVGFNPDDGVYLGGAVQWTSFGFDKNPYKAKQSVLANYAFETGAFNLRYMGRFTELIKPFDLDILARANFPFVFDYNGAGNETEELDMLENTVRLNQIEFSPYLSLSNRSGSSTIRFGAHAKDYRFDDEFNDDGIAAALEEIEDTFLGIGLLYTYENVDNAIAPHRGIRFYAGLSRMNGLDDSKDDIKFTKIRSAVSLYFPLDWMPTNTTLALRSGVDLLGGRHHRFPARRDPGRHGEWVAARRSACPLRLRYRQGGADALPPLAAGGDGGADPGQRPAARGGGGQGRRLHHPQGHRLYLRDRSPGGDRRQPLADVGGGLYDSGGVHHRPHQGQPQGAPGLLDHQPAFLHRARRRSRHLGRRIGWRHAHRHARPRQDHPFLLRRSDSRRRLHGTAPRFTSSKVRAARKRNRRHHRRSDLRIWSGNRGRHQSRR